MGWFSENPNWQDLSRLEDQLRELETDPVWQEARHTKQAAAAVAARPQSCSAVVAASGFKWGVYASAVPFNGSSMLMRSYNDYRTAVLDAVHQQDIYNVAINVGNKRPRRIFWAAPIWS